MGIPGLATRAHKYLQSKTLEEVKGAVFYLDLLNVIHDTFSFKVHRSCKENTYLRDFKRSWAFKVESLLYLKPEKIVFVGDGFVPASKKSVRSEMSFAKFNRVPQEYPRFPEYLALEYLSSISKAGFLETVCCGNEAEDEIMKLIVEDSKQEKYSKSSFFIFSRDSDVYTFKLPDKLAKRVHVVPGLPGDPKASSINSINLQKVHTSGVVCPKHLRPFPTKTPGKSIWNPKPHTPFVLKLYNQVYVYSRHCLLLKPIWVPDDHRWRNIHSIMLPLVKVFHGAFMEKHFPNSSKPLLVSVPRELYSEAEIVPLVQGQPLRDATKLLLERPLWETVVSHFENLSEKEAFEPHEIAAVGAYIRTLVERKQRNFSKTKAKNADILHSYLKVLGRIFLSLEGVLNDFSSQHLLWKVNPWELSRFLEMTEKGTQPLNSKIENLGVSNRGKENFISKA